MWKSRLLVVVTQCLASRSSCVPSLRSGRAIDCRPLAGRLPHCTSLPVAYRHASAAQHYLSHRNLLGSQHISPAVTPEGSTSVQRWYGMRKSKSYPQGSRELLNVFYSHSPAFPRRQGKHKSVYGVSGMPSVNVSMDLHPGPIFPLSLTA